MAIIINDFEIVPDAAPPANAASPAATPQQSTPPKPDDLVQVLRRQVARVARIWAD